MMYRNDDEFVRGQKIKLTIIAACTIYLAIAHFLGWTQELFP